MLEWEGDCGADLTGYWLLLPEKRLEDKSWWSPTGWRAFEGVRDKGSIPRP